MMTNGKRYRVEQKDLEDIIAILQAIGYTPQGEVIHQNILGPAVTQEARDILKRMEIKDGNDRPI